MEEVKMLREAEYENCLHVARIEDITALKSTIKSLVEVSNKASKLRREIRELKSSIDHNERTTVTLSGYQHILDELESIRSDISAQLNDLWCFSRVTVSNRERC